MDNQDTYLAVAGMNVIACPTCAILNQPLKYPAHFGNLFIPISLLKLAFIRVGHVVVYRARCHEGHNAKVAVSA